MSLDSHHVPKVADIIDGVSFMHTLDVVHGDIKTVRSPRTSRPLSYFRPILSGKRARRLSEPGSTDGFWSRNNSACDRDYGYRWSRHDTVHGARVI
jgi:hypothetical protein